MSLDKKNIYYKNIFTKYKYILPEVNAGALESVVGPDGAEDLLIVTQTNLLMINLSKLPADRDSHEVRQI